MGCEALKFKDVWPEVIAAIEKIIACYDSVNEVISFRTAGKAREYAVEQANVKHKHFVLDAGIGPGTMSKIVLSKSNPDMLVGLDASSKMLEAAFLKLNGRIHTVKGMFENLPFKSETFDRIFASFSLRDAVELEDAIKEFHRVCKKNGIFVVVDMGKPDNRIVRTFMTFYVKFIMPNIAKISIVGKISGNPLRLLIPTYENLRTNKILRKSIARLFGKATLKEFAFGGIIVITAGKCINNMDQLK
jgi:demethylmenaquinone methyltransferase/2-methoxy-6-polyprenyl-1,4-benzoquinol methylase